MNIEINVKDTIGKIERTVKLTVILTDKDDMCRPYVFEAISDLLTLLGLTIPEDLT
jgi:hypothetical protein